MNNHKFTFIFNYLITLFLLLFNTDITAQFNLSNQYVSQEIAVNGFSNFYLGIDFAESYIATNPNDPLNTICSFINGSYYTLDGINWQRLNSLNSSDPFLTFDSLGIAYYTPSPPWGNTYGVLKSTDKGISWPNSYLIQTGVTDKPCICGNKSGGPYSNYLYTAWQFYTIGLSFTRSTNQGVNWSNPISISNPSGYCPYLAIGHSSTTPGGNIYYGYTSYDTSNLYIKVRISSNSGVSFSPEITVCTLNGSYNIKNDSVQTNSCVQMATDIGYGTYSGNIYIVVTDKGQGTDLADIIFTKSTNYGLNWSSPIKLNDDNTFTDQWMPSISVDKNGKIYVVWYDSRFDPQNKQAMLYGTVSTNGGSSFVPDFPVSNVPFYPASIVTYFGGAGFMGHYMGVSAIGNTAITSWVDGRNRNFGSYVGFVTDFSMNCNTQLKNFINNDSAVFTVNVPSVHGPFNSRINFSTYLDTLPASGNINISFVNGKNYITNIPDSIRIKVITNTSITPGEYILNIIGRSQDGVPVHNRKVILLVNYSYLTIGTNRNGYADFKVNGILYNTQQQLGFPNNSNVLVQAVSPKTYNNYQYIFNNWSDNGDTSHIIFLNNNIVNLLANYKIQFFYHINSAYPNTTFGSEVFYDSGVSFISGVISRRINYQGITYDFKGWVGYGAGSYTSTDTSGLDSVITLSMYNAISELVIWRAVTGIKQISENIPNEYKLFNNYPNPFNPSTIIRFQIKDSRLVILKVYDILGKKVATLVNEKMPPGVYEVPFSENRLSSGIYFYMLESGDFRDVKKMMYIK
jgi:hypothetical protein